MSVCVHAEEVVGGSRGGGNLVRFQCDSGTPSGRCAQALSNREVERRRNSAALFSTVPRQKRWKLLGHAAETFIEGREEEEREKNIAEEDELLVRSRWAEDSNSVWAASSSGSSSRK